MPSNVNWRNVIARAAWTFFQGALGTITILPYITDLAGWQTIANGAMAGGVSALLSFLKTIGQESLSPSSEPIPIPRHEAEIPPDVEPVPRHLEP